MVLRKTHCYEKKFGCYTSKYELRNIAGNHVRMVVCFFAAEYRAFGDSTASRLYLPDKKSIIRPIKKQNIVPEGEFICIPVRCISFKGDGGMYEIDKEKFGAFVAQLRKEQGITQKELAQKVYISDKAVSKWERGLSMPDITLLIPLSQALGVTVTELLECRRLEQVPMDSGQVEELMHKVITYSEETPAQRQKRRRQEIVLFGVSLVTVVLETLGLWAIGYSWEKIGLNLLIYEPLFFAFSGYFCFFSKDKLPKYYDEYEIDAYSDGIFRMNMPGIHFNNRNWLPIKRAAIRGMLISAMALPVLYFLCGLLFPVTVETTFVFVCLPLFFIAFFGPMYVAAKKYE